MMSTDVEADDEEKDDTQDDVDEDQDDDDDDDDADDDADDDDKFLPVASHGLPPSHPTLPPTVDHPSTSFRSPPFHSSNGFMVKLILLWTAGRDRPLEKLHPWELCMYHMKLCIT